MQTAPPLMTAAALPAPAPRRLAADRLWTASAACLAAMPLAMALANRSAPLVLTLAALAALASVLADGDGQALTERLRAALRTPLGLAAGLFLAFTALSLAWSPWPGLSLQALGEFILPLGAALALALALSERMPRGATFLLAAGVAAACAVILADLATGLWARRLLGLRDGGFIHNRPALTLLVLIPALLAVPTGDPARRVTRMTAGLAAATVLVTDSAAAALGLACGLLAYPLARLAPRPALGLAAAGMGVSLLVAPLLGDAVDRLAPPSIDRLLAGAHARERIETWRSFGAAVGAQGPLGAGFGVSPRLHETPVAAAIEPERRTLLAIGHPHNAALQIWVELGPLGAALALAAALLTLRALATLPAERLPPALALFAAVVAVSLVGHGAWQGWWPAAIGASIVWLRAAGMRAEPA